MRPPSYYSSLANANAGAGGGSNNRSISSQQLRSSLSNSSSASYATRTHLPYVPQTMLVAHCYTGVGSSTKPYGQSTSSLYSSSRLSSGTSYTPSYSSRVPSTKRHHLPASSSSSSNYTPRSSYLSSALSSTSSSSSYRRPSYTYQPIRLRERPLLTRISNQINQRQTNTLDSSLSRPPSGLANRPSEDRDKREPADRQPESESKSKQEEQDWSSDVARNISRNKYLIKFREIDKPRSSLVPDREIALPSEKLDASSGSGAQLFEIKEGPNCLSVTVDLAQDEEDRPTMRLKQPEETGEQPDLKVADPKSSDSKVVDNKDHCDIAAKVASRDCEPKKAKAPKERRNIKLKIKNVKPDQAGEFVGKDAKDQGAATVKVNKKKPATEASSESPAVAPTKTKVKRLAKSKVAPSELPIDTDHDKTQELEAKPKCKDSLLTKNSTDRKVLSPRQLNSSSAAPASNEPSPISKAESSTNSTSADSKSKSRPKPKPEPKLEPKPEPELAVENGSKRIRFREYNYEDFNFLSVLGHGGWGFVILAELKNHDACFAVKCIKKITIVEDDDFDSIMIERKMLTLGNVHPFICKLFCTFETEGYLFFAMEYCAGGDLMFHVQREGKFTEARSRFYAAEIICAIKFLHNQHIIYRDLKLDNILLDSRGHIRLVDFGMCQCRTYREEMLPSNFCGTPEYISPEIIKGVPYNHSVDWWSFGVLLYEMAVGKMPFRGNDENELLWNVCYEQIHYPMFLTKELTSLLQSLLEREPSKRMGMSTCKAGDIYDQAWFRAVDWRAIEELRVPPPFVPDVTSERDVQNFDSDFTQSTPELSPVDEGTLKKIDQSQFQKFPYTNPNISIFG